MHLGEDVASSASSTRIYGNETYNSPTPISTTALTHIYTSWQYANPNSSYLFGGVSGDERQIPQICFARKMTQNVGENYNRRMHLHEWNVFFDTE